MAMTNMKEKLGAIALADSVWRSDVMLMCLGQVVHIHTWHYLRVASSRYGELA